MRNISLRNYRKPWNWGDAMRSDDLIDFLTSEGFSASPDPNFIPDEVKESRLPALFVFGTGGGEAHRYLPIDQPTFQVVVKGKSYKADPRNMAATEEVARSLIRLLDKRTNIQIGDTYAYSVTAMQSNPLYLGLDTHDRPMFSTNFRFRTYQGR